METVIRIAVIFLFITAGLRLLGKKELSELSPFELVMLMLIPDIASQGLVRNDYSLTNAVIGIATLMSLVFINSLLSYHSKRFQKVVEGTATVLFYRGQFFNGI